MVQTQAEYLIEEVLGRGERIKLRSHSTQAYLTVDASGREEAERWVRDRCHVTVRGAFEFESGGLVVERTVYALCSVADPLPNGASICTFHFRSEAHAQTPPSPDFDVFRRRVDAHFGE